MGTKISYAARAGTAIITVLTFHLGHSTGTDQLDADVGRLETLDFE